jgi:hypothetical protein
MSLTHTHEASSSEHNTAFGVNPHEGAASAEASAIQRNSTLTFADRVAYQRAIEEVYWRHRIWPKERPDPKPSLDAVMSQAQLEKKSPLARNRSDIAKRFIYARLRVRSAREEPCLGWTPIATRKTNHASQ